MVKPKEIFAFAAGLLTSGSISEVQARQAAARAYYSVFLLVRDELLVDTSETLAGSHQMVRDKLKIEVLGKTSPPKYLRQALNLWQSLADARIDADYRISQQFAIGRGQRSVQYAEVIFSLYPN